MKGLVLVLTLIRNAGRRSKVRALLEESGHRVIEVSGYSQAKLLLANGLQHDLLLIDFFRAESDGSAKFYDILRRLQEVRAHRFAEHVDSKSKGNSYGSVNERTGYPSHSGRLNALWMGGLGIFKEIAWSAPLGPWGASAVSGGEIDAKGPFALAWLWQANGGF